MRLKLTLLPLNPQTAVPINYNYPLASAIYKILSAASPAYANWLHERGYQSPANRFLKLFTFSKLDVPAARVRNGALTAGNDRPWGLQLASPMEEDFVQSIVSGLFQNQEIQIGGKGAVGRFLIESVESLPYPDFRPDMKGKTLSPFVATTMREYEGKMQPYYYRPTDPELNEALRQNLLSKYETIHGQPCADERLEIRFDMAYFERRQGRVAKLLHIKEGTAEATRIKAFELPFTIHGNPDLMRVAWECGFGDKNSLGLGMIELW